MRRWFKRHSEKFRLIVQTKRKYKKKTHVNNKGKDERRRDREEEHQEKRKGEGTKESPGWTEEESDDRNDSNSDRDQDSDISFMNDGDEEIDTAEIEKKPGSITWREAQRRQLSDEKCKKKSLLG